MSTGNVLISNRYFKPIDCLAQHGAGRHTGFELSKCWNRASDVMSRYSTKLTHHVVTLESFFQNKRVAQLDLESHQRF